MRIAEMEGKVFRNPNGDEYGVIRTLQVSRPKEFEGEVLAEDSCGNFFVLLPSGGVIFLDHETNETTLLAESLAVFCSALLKPETMVLREGQVKSVWVDPEFAKEFGLRNSSK